jgi:hypothetical protein
VHAINETEVGLAPFGAQIAYEIRIVYSRTTERRGRHFRAIEERLDLSEESFSLCHGKA